MFGINVADAVLVVGLALSVLAALRGTKIGASDAARTNRDAAFGPSLIALVDADLSRRHVEAMEDQTEAIREQAETAKDLKDEAVRDLCHRLDLSREVSMLRRIRDGPGSRNPSPAGRILIVPRGREMATQAGPVTERWRGFFAFRGRRGSNMIGAGQRAGREKSQSGPLPVTFRKRSRARKIWDAAKLPLAAIYFVGFLIAAALVSPLVASRWAWSLPLCGRSCSWPSYFPERSA